MFAQCGAMYKTDGPEELRVVGETEFVQVRALIKATQRKLASFTLSLPPLPGRVSPR